jgi:hypothetical protein
MRFNLNNCNVLQITTRTPLQSIYAIQGQVLKNVNSAKYLGWNIYKTLSWDNHVNKVTQRAHNSNPISFSSRNISRCPAIINDQCYSTLARSSLEYAFTVWSPAKKESISQIEAVQLRTARFSSGDYRDELAVIQR